MKLPIPLLLYLVSLGLFGLAAATLASVAQTGEHAARNPSIPSTPDSRSAETVTSGACRSCHPGQYASWHASFHRTMTRLATPATVAGPFEGTRVESEGRTIELFSRGDVLYAKLPDPDVVAALTRKGAPAPSRDAELVSRPVLLATGSHHHEVYWVGGAANELRLVPVTYLIAEKRFIPRRDAFLQPPDAVPHAGTFNNNPASMAAGSMNRIAAINMTRITIAFHEFRANISSS